MDKPLSASAGKPKALFLSPEAPYPMIGGGASRSASLLEYLSHKYAVHAIVFHQPGEPDPARAFPPGLVECIDAIELPAHARHTTARVIRNSIRLARRSPPLLDRFAGFQKNIAAAISGRQYEIAIVEHFWCAPYLEQLRPHARRVLLDLHNIESAWHESIATSSSSAKAWALGRFATASVALERKWLPQFDGILVTSSADAARVRIIAPQSKIIVYPNALPGIARPHRLDKEEIVFSGNLEYAPNIAAVEFFTERVWPALRLRWPELQWKIVGKNPKAVGKIVRGDSRIVLTGFVDDAIGALAEARVAIVPVLSGSGTRVKILEAWAAGTPVVSTTIGAEGLDARHGEHLLIADTPDRFAESVSALLESPEERNRIGMAGRMLYELHYTWPAAWRALGEHL